MSAPEDPSSRASGARGRHPRRVTQRDIAELAGVSQATVSLVLNRKEGGAARIPESTRQRVLEVIAQTTYVADPAARRLAGLDNKIIGVFTYEPAFPTESQDFFAPLLTGIEAAAEQHGSDLLIFTSAPVVGGRRKLFNERNRLRLADGVLLLGMEMDDDELTRLVESGMDAVAVGRRDVPGIPYVGVDYASATADLIGAAVQRGHRRVLYLHVDSTGESVLDRQAGVRAGCEPAAVELTMTPARAEIEANWDLVCRHEPDLLVVEAPSVALALHRRAREAGRAVPEEMSMVLLSAPTRTEEREIDFTRLEPPSADLGAAAVDLLARLSTEDPTDDELRTLLPCPTVDGATVRTRSDR